MDRLPLYSLFFTALFTTQLFAQSPLTEHTLSLDRPENAAKATIGDLSWMTGRWEGTGFGGTVEETWNPPLGGTMAGTFRLIHTDGPNFYEFLLLVPEGQSVVYKVKHFAPDMTGWEEKDESVSFPLVRITPDAAYFHGLTIQRTPRGITQYLATTQKDGSLREVTLEYVRRDLPKSPLENLLDEKLPPVAPVSLMLLGSYHMSNPGLDKFNLESDDVLTPKRQAEIQAVVDRLALWKPTKVAVEVPYGDSAVIARYQAYLQGERQLSRNESEQIGFRLAKQLGHTTIYPVDVRQDLDDKEIGALINSNPAKYGPYMAALQTTGELAMATMDQWLREGTVGYMLFNMNDPALNHAAHGLYFRSFLPLVGGNNYAGADFVNVWYHRNLRIFSNLHKISDRPDDRIFVVYGQGHIPLLQQFAEDSPYFRVEQVQPYLKGL